ncbi:MAG: hypothetical protein N2439_07960, partial [Anaerolineae bacterium]|nr:hypothetical protein [Anaerolineae bacterium]
RLFPPTSGAGYAKTQSLDRINPGQPLNLNVTQGGDYGLVLELPGDKTPVNVLLRDPGWDNIGAPADRTITGRLDVVVCPLADEPTPNGCAKGNTPNFNQGLTWIQVGGSRIYSPAGLVCNPAKFPAGQVYPTCANRQVTNDATCPDEWCARRYDAGGQEYFATITWGAVTRRVIAVVGSEDTWPTRFLLSANTTNGRLYAIGAAVLRAGGPAPGTPLAAEPRHVLWTNNSMSKSAGFEQFDASCYGDNCQGLPLSDYDLDTSLSVKVDPPQAADHSVRQSASYTTDIRRPLQTDAGTEYQTFALSWKVTAEGYAGRPDSPAGNGPLNAQVTRKLPNVSAVGIAG